MLWLLVLFALLFAFINGYRDSSSITAGVIASHSLSPRKALLLTGLAELVAPFLFGSAVAKTLTTGLIDPAVINLGTVLAAIGSALVWTLFSWWRGIPSSSSHALVGGLIGSALVTGGWSAVLSGGVLKVILPLFVAPVVGLLVGYMIMLVILFLTQYASPRVNSLFQRLQIFTMVGLALAHSSNDAQKSMGIIALGLLLEGKINSFHIPGLVVLLCAISIALGASRGDWRLMRTLGRKIYVIRPIDGLASQAASTGIVLASAISGAPVSTSQIISMSLLGAGAADRINKVRWKVGFDMLATWMLTIPATMVISALVIEASRSMDILISLMSR